MDSTLVACPNCGENDYYQADGYYFCKECNIQSQELQDQQAEFQCTFSAAKFKVESKKKQVVDEKLPITTWECYNYVLFEWVKRLIELGASEDLKEATELLWFKYLKVINVVHTDPEKLPKLSAYRFEKNAEIVYGVSFKKNKNRKNKKNAKSPDENNTIAKPKSSLLNKAILQFHDSSAEQRTDMVNLSLANVQSSSIKTKLSFSKNGKQELRKMIGIKALRDLIKGKEISQKYSAKHVRDKETLSRWNIFSILYLAMITIKEDMQLGDLMRLIKFGNFSVCDAIKIIPEEYDTNCIKNDFATLNGEHRHHVYRLEAGQMVDLLKIRRIIPVQDIVSLSKRYCYELNLPVDIEEFVTNLISRTTPKFPIICRSKLPNYEGRTMSFIIFALKIFFSLDGCTEYKLSKFANMLPTKNTFNFNDWIHHLIYRKLLIAEHHFPTQFVNKNHPQYIESYIDYKNKLMEEETCEELYNDLNSFLDKLADGERSAHINFKHSLTPQTDFLHELIDKNIINESCSYLKEHIFKDFRKTSFSYLVNYQKYLNNDVKIVHHGSNTSFEWINLSLNNPYGYQHSHRLLCEITQPTIKTNKCVGAMRHETRKNATIKEGSKKLSTHINTDVQDTDDSDNYKMHYLPDKKFWLHHALYSQMTQKKFGLFFSKFPETFRIIIQECGEIISHDLEEMLKEYLQLEIYMCYHFNIELGWDKNQKWKLKIAESVKFW